MESNLKAGIGTLSISRSLPRNRETQSGCQADSLVDTKSYITRAMGRGSKDCLQSSCPLLMVRMKRRAAVWILPAGAGMPTPYILARGCLVARKALDPPAAVPSSSIDYSPFRKVGALRNANQLIWGPQVQHSIAPFSLVACPCFRRAVGGPEIGN